MEPRHRRSLWSESTGKGRPGNGSDAYDGHNALRGDPSQGGTRHASARRDRVRLTARRAPTSARKPTVWGRSRRWPSYVAFACVLTMAGVVAFPAPAFAAP